jgi:hypothetical protein
MLHEQIYKYVYCYELRDLAFAPGPGPARADICAY